MMEECSNNLVEEGEISDSASIEEITEDVFNKQEQPVTVTTSTSTNSKIVNDLNQNLNNSSNNSNNNSSTRVWTMRDLYKYPINRDYARGLYNLAWAQAVQNKPLDELFVMKKADGDVVESSDKKVEQEKVVIDLEDDVKEEEVEDGELEEGEIDLDADVVATVGNDNAGGGSTNDDDADVAVGNDNAGGGTSTIDVDDDKTSNEGEVNLIKEQLQSVTKGETEKSFAAVCSKLQNSLDSLRELNVTRDDLVQLFMTAIRTVNSVFCSMNQNEKEQNREILSRLLLHAKSQTPTPLSSEQIKEVDDMIISINQSDVSSKAEDNDLDNGVKIIGVLDMNDLHTSSENANQESTLVKKYDLDAVCTKSSGSEEQSMSFESPKPVLAISKARGLSVHLIDLHKDHDMDSLPSPTREIAPQFHVAKASTQAQGMVKPGFPVFAGALGKGNSLLHPYETDAHKAVSSYQQKFGRSSFFVSENLPSPTPSEDGDIGEGDTSGEVSSSNVVHNVSSILNTSRTGQPIVASVPLPNILAGHGIGIARNADPPISAPIPSLRSSTARSRDPRLRLATSDAAAQNLNQKILPIPNVDLKSDASLAIIGSRKQKTVEQPITDGPLSKRQKSEQTDSIIVSDVRPSTGNGGWLEDRGTAGFPVTSSNYVKGSSGNDIRKSEQVTTSVAASISMPSVVVNTDDNVPLTGMSTSTTLHSLLKDIAVNPSIWMNIIKMEQQKSADASKTTTQPSSSSSILGAVPSLNVAAPRTSVTGQTSVGTLQTPPQTAAAADEVGKIRMKPRDPRRVLHNTAVQKGGNAGSEQSKTSVARTQATTNSLCVQKQEDQLDRKSAVTLSTAPPDIAHQFTKNLKNIADMISVSPTSTSLSAAAQTPTQQVQAYPSRLEGKGAVSGSGELPNGTGLASEKVSSGSLPPQSSWGDVEHLFEGYSDQQRAAIQRERTRRLEEQKKMFAARKLCLVLDLDHTLLNSAKYVEIDPAHQDILRKKEIQDREKTYRHLFRFPHMAMWTKLRPGIWNFLEKASKLFELHLYTMGNKLYATEMAKLLDPKGDLFAGRVISRGDDGDSVDGAEPKSKDLEGVLGMESAVVIIDDSVRVWPHNKLNLIVVERYIYFPCSRQQFGLSGPSLLEIDHDERPEDGTLASCLAVIQKIHQNFFAHRSIDEADVRNILATEQQKILAGCRIVFSRVFPVGEANPHLHPLWQTAEQFGAVCTSQIDERVTHVVANSLGTDKVNWALSTGRFVVHPGWVEASALLYRRANEHDFAIKP